MLQSLPLRSRLGLAAVVLAFGVALQTIGWWSQSRLGTQVAATARPGDIQMIGSVTCTYCADARAWFERHHVPFTECTIERDAACAQAYAALMTPGTPVLLVRGQRILGFNAHAVADALAARVQQLPSNRSNGS